MVMMGMLKTIGIEKGKPYEPDDKTKAIFRQAVVDAYHYMQATFEGELPGEAWWDDRKWRNIFFADANKSFKWETAKIWSTMTCAQFVHGSPRSISRPRSPTSRRPCISRPCAMGMGTCLRPARPIQLTVPKDVPVNQFWSLTIYDRDTWAFIYSPQMLPGLSSRDSDKMTE